eukprot:11352145-Ditylum_brightwellii.AAC.1
MISLFIVRATNCCLQGSHVLSSLMSTQHFPCKNGAGVSLLLTRDYYVPGTGRIASSIQGVYNEFLHIQ